MHPKHRSIILIVVSALCGASVPPISKIALEVVSPVSALFIRTLLSTILFSIFFRMVRKPYTLSILLKTWKFSLLLIVNFSCMLIALQYLPTSLLPVVYATIPFITVILNKILNTKDTISPQRIIGIIVGFFGVFIATVSRGFASVDGGVVFGVCTILVGSISFSLYTILSKNHQRTTEPLHLIYGTTLLATSIFFPIAVLDYTNRPYLQNIMWVHVLALVTTAVVGTVIFYSVYQYAIKHSDAVTVSLFTYIQPIFAILLSILLLGETINSIFIVGTAITLFGAYLASNT